MRFRHPLLCLLAAGCLGGPAPASAFQGAISPARFELRARPGDILRQVLEIINDAPSADEYEFRSADWSLTAEGGVAFQEALQADSCRPWLRLERHEMAFPPKKQKRFRFEIHVPAEAPSGECRLAIMVGKTAKDLPTANAGNIRFPVQGRIGVLVYVVIGDAAPRLAVQDIGMARQGDRMVPQVRLHNAGNAHGRAEGVLEGKDAMGKTIEFNVSNFPVLPGETRAIAITPQLRDGASYKLPLRLRGAIEWEGGKHEIDRVFE